MMMMMMMKMNGRAAGDVTNHGVAKIKRENVQGEKGESFAPPLPAPEHGPLDGRSGHGSQGRS